jgi:hypothetical protein
MTVIGALRTDTGLLLGADGVVIADGQALIPAQKVFEVTRGKLGWGFAGPQPGGQRFEEWVLSASVRSWAEMATVASRVVARLNGDARDQARRAATETESLDVLMAGYIGGEGKILYLDDEGGSTFMAGMCFTGAGGPFAHVAWETARRFVSPDQLRTRSTFTAVMEATAKVVVSLDLPVQILELTP